MKKEIREIIKNDIEVFLKLSIVWGVILGGIAFVILLILPIHGTIDLFTSSITVPMWIGIPIYLLAILLAVGIWISIVHLVANLAKYYIYGKTRERDYY